jgi:hypothetical protein
MIVGNEHHDTSRDLELATTSDLCIPSDLAIPKNISND